MLWRAVADDSLDAPQALRARLELAACDLFEDLERGETALDAVRAQLGAVVDRAQRDQIEGRVLAALVDNRVFAGDIARARQHATRLQALLPALPVPEQVDALEVLIELAMREPDIPAAWAWLAALRALAPRRPTVLSYEGQIHWFGGQVQAAHDVLARLLERHPDYCRGITIENDLAVMLHALGDMTQAETMARRSLISWAGVAHTETLSLLVLGSVLTSAGRPDEADAALRRALALAQGQSSAGFEAEARVRRARGLLQAGRVPDAVAELAAARPLLAASTEPLRVSQWVLVSVIAAQAQGQAPGAELLARLGEVGARSTHPLVHARAAQVRALVALAAGDAHAALAATDCQAALARAGGLQELRAEAALLAARAFQLAGRPAAELRACVAEVTALAAQQGLGDILRRVEAWLGTVVDAETVEG